MSDLSVSSVSTIAADIPLDKHSDEPIYQQLIRYFQLQITSGRLQAGTRLPPSRDLAKELGIGRISVVSAYNELQSEGLISAHPGRGTFVTGADIPGRSILKERSRRPPVAQQNLREMVRLAQKPGVIVFNNGSPPDEFLPVDAFRWALDMVLKRDGAAAVTYEDIEGYMPLRQATRDYVTSQGINCRAEDVLITGGAQQALDLVVQAILNPGDILLTTSPTYLGMLDIAHVRRVVPVGLPVDDDGIRLDVLEDTLLDTRARLLFINPTYSNPTGDLMSIHRRRQLLRLAEQYNLMILEDGVYHELHFDEPPPAPLKALDESGIVVHASGYSKILLPGTRIGYLIAEGQARERILRVKQAADICTPSLNQRAVHAYMQRGSLHGHLERIRHILRDRRDAAIKAAQQVFPSGFEWKSPKGGLYLWVKLPEDGPTASELYIAAVQHGVAYAVGSLFFPDGSGTRYLRLNFGAQPPPQIEEGFRRLAAAWNDIQQRNIERKPIL